MHQDYRYSYIFGIAAGQSRHLYISGSCFNGTADAVNMVASSLISLGSTLYHPPA